MWLFSRNRATHQRGWVLYLWNNRVTAAGKVLNYSLVLTALLKLNFKLATFKFIVFQTPKLNSAGPKKSYGLMLNIYIYIYRYIYQFSHYKQCNTYSDGKFILSLWVKCCVGHNLTAVRVCVVLWVLSRGHCSATKHQLFVWAAARQTEAAWFDLFSAVNNILFQFQMTS